MLRSRYGMSKAEMARRSGLPPRTLENYFKGQKPSVDALLAISRGEGVDLDWLLGEATEEKNLNTDLVGEAAWTVLHRSLANLTHRAAQGEEVITAEAILGKEPGQFAAQLEAQIVAEYIALRREYVMAERSEATSSAAERRPRKMARKP